MKKILIISFIIFGSIFYGSIAHAQGTYTSIMHFDGTMTDSLGTLTGTNDGSPSYITGAFASSTDGTWYQTYSPNFSLPLNGQFSITLWVKESGFTNGYLIGMVHDGSHFFLLQGGSDGQVYSTWDDGTGNPTCNFGAYRAGSGGSFHNYIVTYDSSGNINNYVDGSLQNTCAVTNNAGTWSSQLVFNESVAGAHNGANVGVDEFGYATGIFSAGQIVALQTNVPQNSASPPAISFVFPINGTTTAPFSPWLVAVSNNETSTQYQINIHWTRINHDCNFNPGLSDFFTGYCQIYSDPSAIFYGNATGTVPIARPDRNLFYPDDGNTDDLWSAKAFEIDPNTGTVVASTSIQFTMLRYLTPGNTHVNGAGTSSYNNPGVDGSGNLIITTSTNNNTPGQIATSSSLCGDGFWSGLCQIVILPNNAQSYSDAFAQQYAITKTRFPVSIVYTFANAASTTLNGSSTASTTLQITFPSMAGAPTTTFTIMSPTILTDAGVTPSFKDMYFSVARKVLWFTTAIGAVIIPFM